MNLSCNLQVSEDYPIVYLRLCWDLNIKKYCIAEVCDVDKLYSKHRKILVIGIKLPEVENVFEQSFYLSTGYNSLESFQQFFGEKIYIDKNDNEGVWIPFTGFGYEYYDSPDIKLLKRFFDCSTKSDTCLYGRFGLLGIEI